MMISGVGYQVLAANEGVVALKIFKNYHDEIYVVLSDLNMPRMNDLETLTALRQIRPGHPGNPGQRS
jgi:CheY-like chemotaxis protein